jgi:hypothetical protein
MFRTGDGGCGYRHDDCPRAVDDFGVACGDRWCDFGNSLPVDQDVGLFEVAHPRVEAQHDTAAQENSALSAVADQALEI